MEIGFIGLGNMGAPMASNLASTGYEVFGFDIVGSYPEGVKASGSAKDAAEGREIVITMLPDSNALRSVVDEILPVMSNASVILDCSTVDIDVARDAGNIAANAGLLFVDAPVSGGIGGARDGTLTFMAGGSMSAYEKVLPLLEVMGSRIVHCGEVGTGQTAKICNNMILGANMIATCEAFALGVKLNLNPVLLYEVVSKSSGFSWVSNVYCPIPGVGPKSPADNDYKAGFSASLMLKDLRLSQQAASLAGIDTSMGQMAMKYYEKFVECDALGHMDFSAVFLKISNTIHKELNSSK